MKRYVPLLTVLIAGCVIHSVNPIGTEKTQIAPVDLVGQWRLVQGLSNENLEAKHIHPWSLELTNPATKQFRLTTYDEEDSRADFKAEFFKIGGATFLDVMPDRLGDEVKLNTYWQSSVHPVHGVAKVITTNDEMRVSLLNYNWVVDGLKTKRLTLPYAGDLNELILVTASPGEWESFLTQYGSDTNAFPSAPNFILKRLPEKKP